ncbi:hypothetical protein [Blautia hydrogenotrophica]|uniref:hypothetical protein n=1 Tax=Blautia hydrogenotrophica TaxID=53443 RepID=UPI00294236F7|nr:hypothetical protein [Blautia hydrogenotrophica]
MTDGLSASDVAVLTGNNGRNNDGWGGDGAWWIILFLIFGAVGWGGYGNGWGGNGGANSPAFQGYATRADIDAALSTQGIESGIQNISTQLCNGFNTLGSQMANCCCDLKQGQGEINYNLAMQTNALQNTMNQNANALQSQLCNGFRDVIDAQNAGTQRIVDLITTDKIQSLQTELQSAQLQLANVSQTNNIINTLRPTPVPAYITCSPYQATYGYGNGCGNCAC